MAFPLSFEDYLREDAPYHAETLEDCGLEDVATALSEDGFEVLAAYVPVDENGSTEPRLLARRPGHSAYAQIEGGEDDVLGVYLGDSAHTLYAPALVGFLDRNLGATA